MSTDIAKQHEPGGLDGLEDIDAADLVMPILSINHDDAQYMHSLSGEGKKTIDVIGLGVVKQRILWPAEPGEKGVRPVCRSYDHKTGVPDQEKFVSLTKKVPGIFSAADVLSGEPLSCAECPLKEWGTHPKGDGPWCNEQYSIPLLILEGEGEDETETPALISFQRSQIKPVKAWISNFVGKKKPLYSAITRMSLQVLKKGTNEYAVPTFTVTEATDMQYWPGYSESFHSIAGFISTPRGPRGDDEAAAAPDPAPVVNDTGAGGAKRSTPAAAAPAAADPVYGDEEPF